MVRCSMSSYPQTHRMRTISSCFTIRSRVGVPRCVAGSPATFSRRYSAW